MPLRTAERGSSARAGGSGWGLPSLQLLKEVCGSARCHLIGDLAPREREAGVAPALPQQTGGTEVSTEHRFREGGGGEVPIPLAGCVSVVLEE